MTVFPCRQNVTVTCDVFMERRNTGGVFIAARVNKGGQAVRNTEGVFFWVFADGTYKVSNDLGQSPHRLLTPGLHVEKPEKTVYSHVSLS